MYYHGTDNNSAYEILRYGFMKPSIGDNHWLGDGYYFYKDEEYAFRWILLKYTDNFNNKFATDYDDIYSEYTILSAQINENVRIFSLQDINNRLYFIKVKNKLIEKSQYSNRFRNQIKKRGIVDGVVFNIMFEEMGLEKDYDAIEADFPIAFVHDDSRFDYLPENQLCVRNISVIDKIEKYNTEDVPEKYKIFINEYNESKKILKLKNSKNNINKVKMYKKQLRVNDKYNKGVNG